MVCVGEKTEGWIAELLSDLGEIRKDECKEREESLERARRKEYSVAVPLRLRGFLHAFLLVEMTVHFYHHNTLQGISSAIVHIGRFSVYRKSLKGFISTRVIARNIAPSSQA